jgi:8-oxo-dGTP diphosphatase
LSRRQAHQHLAGLWEFPGGKIESGEDERSALIRELAEELGIEVLALRPLIQVEHTYPERTVRLVVYLVEQWAGDPRGRERQEIRWVPASQLEGFDLPPADVPIVTALRLPSVYLITPSIPERSQRAASKQAFVARALRHLSDGDSLLQLRAVSEEGQVCIDSVEQIVSSAEASQRDIVVNARLLRHPCFERLLEFTYLGIHLTSEIDDELRRIERLNWVPRLLGASCHGPESLSRAVRLGADFATLSPVNATASHPDAKPIGWGLFARWVGPANLPVFALGGVDKADTARAWRHGAQGVSGISALW